MCSPGTKPRRARPSARSGPNPGSHGPGRDTRVRTRAAPAPPSRRHPPPAAPALTGRGSSRRPAAGAEGSSRLRAPSPRAGSPGSRCAARRLRPPAGESRPCGARTPGSGSWRERPAGGGPALGAGTSAGPAGRCAETARAGARHPRPTGRPQTRAPGTELRRGLRTSAVPSSASGSQAGRGRSQHSGGHQGTWPERVRRGDPAGRGPGLRGGASAGGAAGAAARASAERGTRLSCRVHRGSGLAPPGLPRVLRGSPPLKGSEPAPRSQPVWPPPLSGPG